MTNAINRDYLRDEESILSELLPLATLNSELSDQVNICATQLVNKVRSHSERLSSLDRFITEYSFERLGVYISNLNSSICV